MALVRLGVDLLKNNLLCNGVGVPGRGFAERPLVLYVLFLVSHGADVLKHHGGIHVRMLFVNYVLHVSRTKRILHASQIRYNAIRIAFHSARRLIKRRASSCSASFSCGVFCD